MLILGRKGIEISVVRVPKTLRINKLEFCDISTNFEVGDTQYQVTSEKGKIIVDALFFCYAINEKLDKRYKLLK